MEFARIDPMKVDGDKIASVALHDAFKNWCGNTIQAGLPEKFHKAIAKVGIAPSRNLKIQGIHMKAHVVNKETVRAGFRDAFKMPGLDWSEEQVGIHFLQSWLFCHLELNIGGYRLPVSAVSEIPPRHKVILVNRLCGFNK